MMAHIATLIKIATISFYGWRHVQKFEKVAANKKSIFSLFFRSDASGSLISVIWQSHFGHMNHIHAISDGAG